MGSQKSWTQWSDFHFTSLDFFTRKWLCFRELAHLELGIQLRCWDISQIYLLKFLFALFYWALNRCHLLARLALSYLILRIPTGWVKVAQSCPTLCNPSSPGQNTEVGSLSLLQRIFQTQRSNPGLPHCRPILYQLSDKGRPRILEWVVYPFASGPSWPRNQTRVSYTAVRFFTNWAIREALTMG